MARSVNTISDVNLDISTWTRETNLAAHHASVTGIHPSAVLRQATLVVR